MENLQRHNHDGANSNKVSFEDLIDKPRPIDLRHNIYFAFENTTRYVNSSSGAGASITFDTSGVTLVSGTASNSYAYLAIAGDLSTLSIFDNPLVLDFVFKWTTESNGTHKAFVVIGSAGGVTTTYTDKHFGFEFVANAASKILGTVGNGTVNTTVVLDTSGLTLSDDNIFTAVYSPSQAVVFYINGRRVGVITDGTKLPRGVPSNTGVWGEVKTIRDNSGSANTIIMRWMNYHVPLEGAFATKL